MEINKEQLTNQTNTKRRAARTQDLEVGPAAAAAAAAAAQLRRKQHAAAALSFGSLEEQLSTQPRKTEST